MYQPRKESSRSARRGVVACATGVGKLHQGVRREAQAAEGRVGDRKVDWDLEQGGSGPGQGSWCAL